ncbi:hypothetical protein [Laceyella putida]|uniref:Uncharacterized protein n=1 Tax=Laceyella putida TaxID=110101 RepID=A0ABW2RF88_9BACL
MKREWESNPREEWTDGELANYPAKHDPGTHVTAGIQEAYNLHPDRTVLPDEKKE